MTKDTKEIVAKSFLVLALQKDPITITKLSELSGVMRPTIRANFGSEPLVGIANYLYFTIDKEIQEKLLLHEPEEISAEIFANIMLPILYRHRDIFRVLFTSPHLNYKYGFAQLEQKTEVYFSWAKARFDRVAKESGLGPSITGKDLFNYWIRWLNSVWILWLSSEIPDEPQVFKKKFLFLMRSSMSSMINRKKIEEDL